LISIFSNLEKNMARQSLLKSPATALSLNQTANRAAMSHLSHFIKHLNSYDVKESVYSSDCPNLIRSFIENRTQATDRDSLNKLDICKFFNAVAKLRNQGFNGDLETLLAVLKGEATLKLSSKSQEVKETLADNKLSVIIPRELT
jgi:uncharacterized protein (DUF2342 family)